MTLQEAPVNELTPPEPPPDVAGGQNIAANADGSFTIKPRELPFSSILATRMDQTREDALVEHCMVRKRELETETGWMQDSEHPDRNTWFGIREIAQKKYDGKLDFRAGPGTIFAESNVTFNTVKRQVRSMTATVVANTIGTKPFFTTTPIGDFDPELNTEKTGELSKAIEKYADHKIDGSNCEKGLRAGLQNTCIKGEQVYKIAYRKTVSHTVEKDTVLVLNGQPVRTPDDEVIYPGEIVPDATIPQRIHPRDFPDFEIPAGATFELLEFDDEIIHYDGPDVSPSGYKNFLCPLNVPSIHDADINIFIYDMPVERVTELYQHPSFREKHQDTPIGEQAAQIAADLEGETSGPKTPQSMPKTAHGERTATSGSEFNRMMQVAECYLLCDADGDGRLEEILMVIDVKRKKAVYYEYLGIVFTSGRRPFEVTTIGQVEDRWYGTGLFEQYDKAETFIDTQLNRANHRESASGRMDFQNPRATDEADAGQPMTFGNDTPYTLRDGFKKEDAYDFLVFPPLTEGIMALQEKMTQAIQVESGIISAADGKVSDLNVSKTKYGIENIERNSANLMGFNEAEMQIGVGDVIRSAVKIIFEHMDDETKFSFSEQDEQVVMTLSKNDIRDLDFKVDLRLDQKNTAQSLQNMAAATALFNEYDAKKGDPQSQKAARSLYIQQMKVLKVPEADSVIYDPDSLPAPKPPSPPPSTPAQLLTAYAALLKTGQVTMNIDDLNGMLAQAGLPPVAPMPQPTNVTPMPPQSAPDNGIPATK